MSSSSDTIYALSSGSVPSGVSVIRLSGTRAAQCLVQLTGSCPLPRYAALRTVRRADGSAIDTGLTLFFPGPASVTGEDCAEFHLHGGRAVVAELLRILAGMKGLRQAEEGEFTRRAFINGKLDLAQVEALGDLIEAETESQRRLALLGLEGRSSALYCSWHDRLTKARAFIEAELDFADEGDVPAEASGPVWEDLRSLIGEMDQHLEGRGVAEIIRGGFKVAIMGPPNAGKSSLLNALARREAAIVSSEPGTTRDLVEVTLDISGHKVCVVDTAGIRNDPGVVEAIGIARAREAGSRSDLVIWLDPADVVPDGEMDVPEGAMRYISKADLLVERDKARSLSSQTGEGLEELLMAIKARLDTLPAVTEIPARLRHAALVEECRTHIVNAVKGSALPLELRAEELRSASYALGRIVGFVDVEDLLDRIFSSFCIGK